MHCIYTYLMKAFTNTHINTHTRYFSRKLNLFIKTTLPYFRLKVIQFRFRMNASQISPEISTISSRTCPFEIVKHPKCKRRFNGINRPKMVSNVLYERKPNNRNVTHRIYFETVVIYCNPVVLTHQGRSCRRRNNSCCITISQSLANKFLFCCTV